MSPIRMYPPPDLSNVTYGMRRVGPEGVDMHERDAKLHEQRGWSRKPFTVRLAPPREGETYQGVPVGREGVDVYQADAPALRARGWLAVGGVLTRAELSDVDASLENKAEPKKAAKKSKKSKES